MPGTLWCFSGMFYSSGGGLKDLSEVAFVVGITRRS